MYLGPSGDGGTGTSYGDNMTMLVGGTGTCDIGKFTVVNDTNCVNGWFAA